MPVHAPAVAAPSRNMRGPRRKDGVRNSYEVGGRAAPEYAQYNQRAWVPEEELGAYVESPRNLTRNDSQTLEPAWYW